MVDVEKREYGRNVGKYGENGEVRENMEEMWGNVVKMGKLERIWKKCGEMW